MTSAASGLAATVTVATLLAWNATPPAAATIYTIGTFADGATVDGNCTLREALRAADDNVKVDNCPAGTFKDSIILPNGNYDFYGEAALDGPGRLVIEGMSSNPLLVTVNLRRAGRFLRISGGGAYAISGIGIGNGIAGGDGRGGAIHASNVHLTINNSRFVANTAAQGGAAFAHVEGNRSASFRDVHFIGNSVSDGTERAGWGGALSLEALGKGSYAECIGCNFVGNSAVSTRPRNVAGPGAAALRADDSAVIVLRDCRFTGNSARGIDGLQTHVLGAHAFSDSHIALDRLFIDWNEGGGGDNAFDVMVNSFSGGTISLVDSQLTFGAGSGLSAGAYDPGTVQLGHLTIADYPSRGVRIQTFGAGQALLQNSIVSFNGNDLEIWGALSQTTNFIGGDPHFLDEPSGDYHLAPSSPAIDAGTTGVETYQPWDLDLHPRLAGSNTDLGCYERPF